MMYVKKYILVGICMVFCIVACEHEELSPIEKRQGTMSLSVDKVLPIATRGVETADFPVTIYSMDEDKEIVSYERADQVPKKIQLAVGMYYAEAHTPGQLQKKMNTPYYSGREEFEILQNVNTISTINCRMANGAIKVSHTEEFVNVFADCVVTVDDGSQTAIIYSASDADGYAPVTHYICFEENTKALYVNVAATTREEKFRSTMNFTLTKREASERYDDDVEYFQGGDCIVINCDTTNIETTEGSITGIIINADIQFTESEEDVEIDVEDFIPEGDDDDDSGDESDSDDSDAITLNLPEDMVVSMTTDPSLGDTYIAAEHGIKSIMVQMTSTSDDMMMSLASLAENYEGVDFVAGAEVVGNQNMVALFSELQQSLTVPSEGDTEYTFPIGNFFTLLSVLPGEHTFTMTVTDMQGATKNGVLTLTVE